MVLGIPKGWAFWILYVEIYLVQIDLKLLLFFSEFLLRITAGLVCQFWRLRINLGDANTTPTPHSQSQPGDTKQEASRAEIDKIAGRVGWPLFFIQGAHQHSYQFLPLGPREH